LESSANGVKPIGIQMDRIYLTGVLNGAHYHVNRLNGWAHLYADTNTYWLFIVCFLEVSGVAGGMGSRGSCPPRMVTKKI
jgi:hypothetical protein